MLDMDNKTSLKVLRSEFALEKDDLSEVNQALLSAVNNLEKVEYLKENMDNFCECIPYEKCLAEQTDSRFACKRCLLNYMKEKLK